MKTYSLLTILLLVLVACKGTKMASSSNKGTNTEATIVKGENVKEKDAVRPDPQTAVNDSARFKKKDSTIPNAADPADTAGPDGVASQTKDTTGGKGRAYLSPRVSPTISDMDLKKIYKELQMTNDQINAFEKTMQDFKETVKYHANGEMLGTVGNEQERQLKRILKEDQWKRYQEWKKGREQ